MKEDTREILSTFRTSHANIHSFHLSLNEGHRNALPTACVPEHIRDGDVKCCTLDHKLEGVRGAQGMVIGMMLLPGINELSSSATAVPPQSLRL